ncbi:hypothetical protein E7Z59_03745 [Robertkochia marina]|uniref:Isoleucyl-tRNA synthetase n=1 Tax=Robertkochia marina TaxID=1227945 RepID=A0A4S3M539_9FLAO|nr:hypothetical protein [Robertkochia marina]THD69451.1 hypothetical protein E7Z59_03745 [Robertkochia marina]TRZ47288.1 hypothetical protein D3A96_00830 [Robertkochia marina]
MKRLLQALFFLILAAIGVGYYFKWQNDHLTGDRIVGIAVLTAAFVLMPLFIFHRSKGKKLKDYTLTPENLEKMKDEKHKKTNNQ